MPDPQSKPDANVERITIQQLEASTNFRHPDSLPGGPPKDIAVPVLPKLAALSRSEHQHLRNFAFKAMSAQASPMELEAFTALIRTAELLESWKNSQTPDGPADGRMNAVDYFAGAALTGAMQTLSFQGMDFEKVARNSWKLAYAMMAARKVPQAS